MGHYGDWGTDEWGPVLQGLGPHLEASMANQLILASNVRVGARSKLSYEPASVGTCVEV